MRRRSIETLERFHFVITRSFEKFRAFTHFDATRPARTGTTRKLDRRTARITHVDQTIRWFSFCREDMTSFRIFEVDPDPMSHSSNPQFEHLGLRVAFGALRPKPQMISMVMQHDFDVVIIGGGPGGSTLASSLAKRGRRALVLEREKFPRFHIGESLLPCSRSVFHTLGLDDELERRFIRKYGARFLCSTTKRTNTYHFAEAYDASFEYAYQVPRAEFDKVLLDHAKLLGAEVREEWEVTEVIFDGSRALGVRARSVHEPSKIEEIRAPIIADATGRDTLLASRTRRKAHIPRLDKTAFFSHFRGTFRQEGLEEGNIQIVIFEHGWFWFIPFRGDLTSVGAVVSSDWIKQREKNESLDAFFMRTVAQSSWASEFLSSAKQERSVGALADFSYRIDQLAGDGWLFVGDAGGFLDPLFSTGAHLAIQGGFIGAETIDEALRRGDTSRAAFKDYEAAVRYAVDLFLGVVQGFYAGHFRELLFEENQRKPMRRIITSILSGDVFHQKKKPQWAPFVQGLYPAEVPTFV
jgi:flavin-dependent dehydrogenase